MIAVASSGGRNNSVRFSEIAPVVEQLPHLVRW